MDMTHQATHLATHILGIDIAKHKFDVALIVNGKFKNKVFDNNPTGFIALNDWLHSHHIKHLHACMEATGIYWEALATYLADAQHAVSVVNPAQIAAYAKSVLQRGKTDVQDACLIARYGERERPALWQPAPASQRELLQLVRQLQHLNESYQAEHNRLHTSTGVVHESIAETLAFLSLQIQQLTAKINQHIDQDPTLKQNCALLDSIPGVGDKTAPWLLAYLGTGERFGRGKQAAAFAGLTPRPWQSGSSVRGKSRISKTGHSDLRRILFMPALATYGRKKAFVAFVERLKASGKTPKEIVVALMRKIITIAQAVLRSQTPFNAELHAN
jgi:transposase